MGWFSPVKGSYPSLSQVDKTLPVKSGVTTIARGTIVALETDASGKSAEGVFDLAVATDKLLYVALQDYTDPTAGFAGTSFVQSKDGLGVPRITALSLTMDGEYETTEYATDNTYTVGQALYVVNGKLTNVEQTNGTIVGYVTAPATERWINNAVAIGDTATGDARLAVRTGANKYVLRFRTAK